MQKNKKNKEIKFDGELLTNTMYVLSGSSESRKTFLTRMKEAGIISSEMIISCDKTRKKLLGEKIIMEDDKVSKELYHQNHTEVFGVMKEIAELKAKSGLTFFIDDNNFTDKERVIWFSIAKKYNLGFEVLILDEEIEEKHHKMFHSFERKSILTHRLIKEKNIFSFKPRYMVEKENIDVIGDIHGLKKELFILLSNLGYEITEGVITHKQGRKIMFLGDLIDRGPDSLEILELVYNSVTKGGHFCVIGNHEVKLIDNYESYKNNTSPSGSPAVISTFLEFIKLKEQKQVALISWLKALPAYMIINTKEHKFACVHANVGYFCPLKTPREEMIFGDKERKFETDEMYQTLFDKGINKYSLLRGHVEQKYKRNNVISLEENGAFGGFLCCLSLDKIDYYNKKKLLTMYAIKRIQSKFNYKTQPKTTEMYKELESLMQKGLIKAKSDKSGLFKVFKYTKDVSYGKQWNVSPLLFEARGLVLDLAGNIVQHPFTKIFNYGENSAGLNFSDKKEFIAVEKKNGFLINITKHPYKNDLLLTTVNSFEGIPIERTRDFLNENLRINLLKFLSKNNLTLMFEILHPMDKHIVIQTKEEEGMWLIGAKGKSVKDKELAEDILDEIGKEIEVRRPKWFLATFKEIKTLCKKEEGEGYILRDKETNVPLLKFKTISYISKKFLSRLNETNIRFLFSNPGRFKESLGIDESIEEELFPIIDGLMLEITETEFKQKTVDEKIKLIEKICNNLIF